MNLKQHQSENGKKSQAKCRQHHETKFLLHENCFLSTLSSKNNPEYSKNYVKNNCVCINGIWLIIITMEMKNWSCRYDVNRPMARHGHKYTK